MRFARRINRICAALGTDNGLHDREQRRLFQARDAYLTANPDAAAIADRLAERLAAGPPGEPDAETLRLRSLLVATNPALFGRSVEVDRLNWNQRVNGY